jgi:hypothetical protein
MTDDESQCRRNCLGTRRSERHRLQSTETNELEQQDETYEITAITEECPCERITLELEDWSTCLIEDQRRSCGAGTRYRRRKCIVTSTSQLAPLRSVRQLPILNIKRVAMSFDDDFQLQLVQRRRLRDERLCH